MRYFQLLALVVSLAAIPAHASSVLFPILSTGSTFDALYNTVITGSTIYGAGIVGAQGAITESGGISTAGSVVSNVAVGAAITGGWNPAIAGECASAGGTITFNNVGCGGGSDTTGTSSLLTDLNTAISDVSTLQGIVSGLTPTDSIGALNLAGDAAYILNSANSGQVVFDITSLTAQNQSTLVLSGAASDVFLLNIGSFSALNNFKIELAGGLLAKNVLLNITGDVQLLYNPDVTGTILSSGACEVQAGSLVGALWCNGAINFKDSNQVDHDPFTARVFAKDSAGDAPVPEPSTYALMASGLGLVALLRRRRSVAGRK